MNFINESVTGSFFYWSDFCYRQGILKGDAECLKKGYINREKWSVSFNVYSLLQNRPKFNACRYEAYELEKARITPRGKQS